MGYGGITLIKQILHQFSPSERKIADYIINHPEEVIHMTAKEVGEATQSSSAGVVRVSKAMGLSGWQELKILIASESKEPESVEYREVSKGESVGDIISKISNNTYSILEQTKKLVDEKKCEQVIRLMHEAKRIHFYGIGASYVVALDAMQKWTKINKDSTSLSDTHLLSSVISNADKNDLLFAISFSGETKEVKRLAEIAKNKGIQVISLTTFSKNPLSKMADVALYSTSTEEPIFRTAATISRISQMLVMDILFFSYVSTYYHDSIKAIDNSRTIVREFKDSL